MVNGREPSDPSAASPPPPSLSPITAAPPQPPVGAPPALARRSRDPPHRLAWSPWAPPWSLLGARSRARRDLGAEPGAGSRERVVVTGLVSSRARTAAWLVTARTETSAG